MFLGKYHPQIGRFMALAFVYCIKPLLNLINLGWSNRMGDLPPVLTKVFSHLHLLSGMVSSIRTFHIKILEELIINP